MAISAVGVGSWENQTASEQDKLIKMEIWKSSVLSQWQVRSPKNAENFFLFFYIFLFCLCVILHIVALRFKFDFDFDFLILMFCQI